MNYFIGILFILLVFPHVIYAQNINPTSLYPTQSASDQVKKKQNDIVKDVFQKLFNEETPRDPIPTVNPRNTITPSIQPGNNPIINPTDIPLPTYSPIMPANTQETQYADLVVSTLRKNCFTDPIKKTGAGIVTYANRDCLNSLQGIMNEKGIAEHYASPNRTNYYLQCVGCARAMAAARGRDYNGLGNAAQHIGINGKSNVSGYTYYSNTSGNYQHLVAGSLGISNKNHIWYITDVIRDTNGTPIKYRAYECNFGAKGLVSHNIYDVTSSYFTGWQKPNTL